MYSHNMVGSNDIARSKKFYDALFTAIGGNPGIQDDKGRLIYMHNDGLFLVTPPIDGQPATAGNGCTIGFAMASPEQARLFNRGDIMNDCRMMLPEEGLLVVTLSVRNMFDVITRTGARHVRIGCEYVGLPSVRMTMVQRYITRIERERKARLSGMA